MGGSGERHAVAVACLSPACTAAGEKGRSILRHPYVVALYRTQQRSALTKWILFPHALAVKMRQSVEGKDDSSPRLYILHSRPRSHLTGFPHRLHMLPSSHNLSSSPRIIPE